MEILAHKDYLRILHAVRTKPMRFGQLQRDLDLNPAQVDRAVKFLSKGLWIVPAVADTATGRIVIVYVLGKRGAALLEAFRDFSASVFRRRAELGSGVVSDLRDCGT